MKDDLTTLEALEQAATPGPWKSAKHGHMNASQCVAGPDGLFIAEFADGENEDLAIALRNAAPSLFARIRQAERERDEARRERDDLREQLYSAVYSGQGIAFDPSAYPADWPGNIDDDPPIPAELAWMAEGALAVDVCEALAIKGIPEWDRHLDRWVVTVIDRDGYPTQYDCSDLAQLVTEKGSVK